MTPFHHKRIRNKRTLIVLSTGLFLGGAWILRRAHVDAAGQHLPHPAGTKSTTQRPIAAIEPGAPEPVKNPVRAAAVGAPSLPRGIEIENSVPLTGQELAKPDLMMVQYDGTINPAFFTAFKFSEEQKKAFLKRWDSLLFSLQSMESFKIVEEFAEGKTKRFWIKEFPEVGSGLREGLIKELGEVAPEAASRFIVDHDNYDRIYTFSDFGKLRRFFEVTPTRSGWTMIEQFFQVSGNTLIPLGWRRHEFGTIPPRFKLLFEW